MDRTDTEIQNQVISLPAAKTTGTRALEQVVATRRSIREYSDQSLTLEELAQLLWACQGITSKDNLRTTNSAGATYPYEDNAALENERAITPRNYHYLHAPGQRNHTLELVQEGSVGKELCQHSSKQEFIRVVPVNIIFTGIEARTRKEYGDSAPRYVLLEAGHAAQNLHLQAEALGLGSVAIGYVDATEFRRLLCTDAEPLYMVSVGRGRK